MVRLSLLNGHRPQIVGFPLMLLAGYEFRSFSTSSRNSRAFSGDGG